MIHGKNLLTFDIKGKEIYMKFKLSIIIFIILLSGCAAVITTPFTATVTSDGKYWILDKPLTYKVDGKEYLVPEGFVTDLTSVPRVFWSAFPPCGNYTPAAVVHDYLYWVQPSECSKKCADDILLSAMKSSNVKYVTRIAIYKAVDEFGQTAWDRNARAKLRGTIREIPQEFPRNDPNETWEQMETRLKLWLTSNSE